MDLDPNNVYLLTIPQMAHMLAMGESTLYQAARKGTLPVPVFKLDGAIRVKAADVETYLSTGKPVSYESRVAA